MRGMGLDAGDAELDSELVRFEIACGRCTNIWFQQAGLASRLVLIIDGFGAGGGQANRRSKFSPLGSICG